MSGASRAERQTRLDLTVIATDLTTTVQVIDRVHDVLRQLARRELPNGVLVDDSGQVRLVIRPMDWHAYVRLGFDEMGGAGSPQVARRLRAALDDLIEYAPADRRAPLTEQLNLLSDAVEQAAENDHNLQLAQYPDPLGLGVEAGDIQAEVSSPTAR